MARLHNLARMTTSTTGYGPVTLGAAVAGHLTFNQAGLRDGDDISYAIKDGAGRELGRGIYSIDGPMLTRVVLQSTNNDEPLDLSGAAEVFIVEWAGGGIAFGGGNQDVLPIEEGPGIDLFGERVGLGGDSILLYRADGEPAEEFQASDTGLDLAAAAVTSTQDRIEVPQNALLTADHTLAACQYFFLPGSSVSGEITLPAGIGVYWLNLVRAEESEDPLVGVVGPSSGTAILNNCHVDVTNTGAGNGYGIQAGAGMVMVWNSWAEGNATGGGSGYGIFATEGFVEVYGGSLAGTTARVFGVGGGTETIRNATAASIKSLSLWNGSSNDSPPANWETVAYNDAAWTAASAKSDWAVVITGADTFWTSDTGAGKRSLFRDSFTLSLTDVVSAILYWDGDDACEGIYVNGTLMDSWPIGIIGDDHGVREIDVSGELNFSGDNVIALSSTNTFDTVPAVGGSLVFKLIVLTGDGTILVHAAEGTVAPTEEPMWGDRAAWDVDDYGARHASDIHDAVSLNHLPTPTNQSADAGKAVVLNPTASAYVLGEEGSAAGGSFEVAITDVSNPPTEAQLITAFGPPDEFAGLGILNDNAADNNVYAVFSDLGHYWILPLAKAVVAAPNVAVAATTILAEDAGQWFGRAALELLPNGTWVLLYREAPAHADNGVDVLHIKFSDDEGETWTAEDTDLNGSAVAGFPMTPPSGTIADSEGPGEPWLILAPNGTLILHMWSVEYGVTNEGTYQSISTDNGITWTTPAQINFTGIADDANVFTTDDHFVYNGVIYISARRYDDVTPTNSKSIFLKSTDNGATWVYVADISSFTTDTWECALEYIGNDTIIALLRDKAFLKTYKSVSTDMGVTWSALSDITSAFGAIMGRTRLSTRAHIKGQENWWLDSVLIAYGFEQVDSGLAHDRRNAIWISPDRGTTWSGPHYVAAEIEDAGYGDMLYAASRGEWVFISYQGTLAEADLVQYDLTITGI